MDGWTRRSWETAVLWVLKQDGAATTLPSRRITIIRVVQPGTWEARTRSCTRGVTNNPSSDGLIYVVVDADRDTIEGAKEELDKRNA